MIKAGGAMFKCRCGSCQQIIPWERNKEMILKGDITCPNCKIKLVFSGQAKLISIILVCLLAISTMHFLWVWGINETLRWLILILAFSIVGRCIDIVFVYAVSQILSLDLVPQSKFRIW